MNYEEIVNNIVKRESSTYTNDPTDPGGPTKFGITLATLRRVWKNKHLRALDVQSLTRAEAAQIYRERYILAPKFDRLSPHNDKLARLLIDTGVLHGQAVAVKMLQRAVGATPDGKLGPKTRRKLDLTRGDEFVYHDVLTQRVNREIEKVLASVKRRYGPMVRKTTKLKYLRGWVVGRTLKEFL